ncbi:MAG: Eco57I restriction-modification methylase domain-containing protein [Anaerolineae bacterium]|nr:Eco57I restriction-modification methylase domain-containing protein [Anaerolineae bacterium]
MQKKRWLNGNPNYLFDLYDQCERYFYDDYLFYVLFAGLNNPDHTPPQGMSKTELDHRIGQVPFLNGGLFEQFDDWDVRGRLEISNEIFDKILGEEGLFRRYNFTITESTPFDIEVAIDPEMLGKIFEGLVTGRHESGSYYTPKPVVSFMCREALKGYLVTSLPHENTKAIETFVDEANPAQLKNPEKVLEALRTVKACDPACGSGAYLLGLLHELLDLRAALFTVKQLDAGTVYERKLEIIQRNLYGVDKDEFAVNIARLRLWLSLIVDFGGAIPPPLPNLNYKIEVGDSLTAPDPSGGLEIGFRSQLVDDFLRCKNEFLTAHHTRKAKLHEDIERLRSEIKLWSGRAAHAQDFDWTVEFAEIFVQPTPSTTVRGAMAGLVNTTAGQMELAAVPDGQIGFDIVLANPPYVRADAQFKHIKNEEKRQREIANWKKYRAQLKDSKIYTTLHEKWDLYVPFLERAYQLLHSRGQMVFIIPDAYNAAKYANKSHQFFLAHTRVERIDFCSEINLFNAGVNNTILHFAKEEPMQTHKPVRVRRWGKRDEFDENVQYLESERQNVINADVFRLIIGDEPRFDSQTALDSICYISKGMVIHSDDDLYQGLFSTEDVLSGHKDKSHPKRFVLGKDILKWYLRKVRFLEWGTSRAPSKFSRPTFKEFQEAKEKLVAVRTPGAIPKVIYDSDSLHFDASSVGFVPWHLLKAVVNKSISKTSKYHRQDPLGDRETREEISRQFQLKYVLAIMNSSFAREWLNRKRRSKMHVYPDDWKKLPIAPISIEQQKPFVELVDQILREYEQYGYPLPKPSADNVSEWERTLDDMVEKLYKE